MSNTAETILVSAAVAVACTWAVRAIWRSIRSGGACSSCSGSGDCPLVNEPQNLAELGKIEKCGPGAYECPAQQDQPGQDQTTP